MSYPAIKYILGVSWLTIFLPGCSQPETDGDLWFVEEAAIRGIEFTHRSGFSGDPLMPETVGGGVTLTDVDGDGDLDVYLVQSGWNLAAGPRADSPGNQLFINRGDGYFDAAKDPGAADDRGYGMGAIAGDYDNDGDNDLYVTNLGPNALLRNDGSGHFDNVAVESGVDDPGWSTAAAFHDLDNDGDLDLFVVNYLSWSPAIEKECFSRGLPTYCAPNSYDAPVMDRLYRNNGDGSFTDITLQAGFNRSYGAGFGVVGADFNNDGLIDLFVANDGMPDQLWINKGNLRFDDQAEDWGCAVNDSGVSTAGMGVAAADVDNDGDWDLLVVNIEGEADSFFRNEGTYFTEISARTGIAMPSRLRTRFGVVFADFDNDGYLDLYEANGKVDGDPGAVPDAFAEPNTLFRGSANGAFEELMPPGGVAIAQPYTGRALAVGDVNGDGGLDLLMSNRDGPAQLLINNVANRGNWVRMRIVTKDARDALGASVSVMIGQIKRRQTVRTESSFLSSHDPVLHFGLGNESLAREITVRWPDGALETFGDLEAGERATFRRGNGQSIQGTSATIER